MSKWRFRFERAVQLGREGDWKTIAERVARKLTPRGEPPEAQEDPAAYARWRAKHKTPLPNARAVPITVCVLPPRNFLPAFRRALKEAKTGWLVVALPGTVLDSSIELYIAALATKKARFLTWDHDEKLWDGRVARPFFKPPASPTLLAHQPYVLPAFALKAPKKIPPGKTPAEFLHALALANMAPKTAQHLPLVLATASGPDADKPLRPKLKSMPAKVSILIPFRDKPELLDRCLETLFSKTRGAQFEVLLLDNGSVEPATASTLARWRRRTRHVRLDGAFNFSWLNNEGVKRARGSHVLLLNNDTEIIDRDWLRAMLLFATQKDVGAVGARLLYPDGTLQHGGVLLGVDGLAAHALSGAPANAPGHHGIALVPHEVSAVTAACLLVEKKKYNAVKGLDERRFKVAFNDLDLCLKLEKKGWRTIYQPDAVLVHHESKSRGSRVTIAEDRAFANAWPGPDAYLNENFSRLCPDFRWR